MHRGAEIRSRRRLQSGETAAWRPGPRTARGGSQTYGPSVPVLTRKEETMRRPSNSIAVALIALLATLAVAPAMGQQTPADRRLPRHVGVFLSFPNVQQFKARFAQTNWGRLANDPSLADFCESVRRQFDKATARLRKDLGVTWEELWELPAGEVTLAVVNEPRERVATVLFVDFGSRRETVDRLIEALNESFDAQPGNRRRTEQFAGTTLHVYSKEVNKAGPDGQSVRKVETAGAYFIRESTVVIGQTVQVLKSVLTRWDGRHEDTFAESENYRYIRSRAGGNAEPALVWYLDLVGLLKSAVETAEEPNVGLAMVVGMLPTVGLANLKAVGGTVHLASEPYDTISRTVIVVDEPLTGVLAALQFPATDLTPPTWVPESVAAYLAFNWDVQKAYEAIGQLFDAFRGPGAFQRVIEQAADPERGAGIHIKQDVLDHLNGRFRLLRFKAVAGADGLPQQDMLVAIGVKNESRIQSVLGKLGEQPGRLGKAREFRGVKIYEVPAGPGKAPMGVAVTNGNLFFATNVAKIEEIIRGSNEAPLAQSLDYRRLAAHIPRETSLLSFQRQEGQMRLLYDLLKKQGPGWFPDIDFATLPQFDAIARYFPPSAGYAVPEKRGAVFVSFSLRE
ncbi:MAG: hypothetical protein D6725_10305 [Planctomycetota bacterium]|nr:MAG: hypothetical protein D6725_10305 [Planctomycetota bacterium]